MVERGVALALVDWSTARQLEAAGFQCGAHSMNHPHLADLDAAACHMELRESQQLLEERLGHEVRHLAYPYGSCNDTVRAIVAECSYQSACSTRIGLSDADDDLLALHRVPVNGQESFFDFICRLSTAGTVRETMQSMAHITLRQLQLRGA